MSLVDHPKRHKKEPESIIITNNNFMHKITLKQIQRQLWTIKDPNKNINCKNNIKNNNSRQWTR